jgi:hypothetical protein
MLLSPQLNQMLFRQFKTLWLLEEMSLKMLNHHNSLVSTKFHLKETLALNYHSLKQ